MFFNNRVTSHVRDRSSLAHLDLADVSRDRSKSVDSTRDRRPRLLVNCFGSFYL